MLNVKIASIIIVAILALLVLVGTIIVMFQLNPKGTAVITALVAVWLLIKAKQRIE